MPSDSAAKTAYNVGGYCDIAYTEIQQRDGRRIITYQKFLLNSSLVPDALSLNLHTNDCLSLAAANAY